MVNCRSTAQLRALLRTVSLRLGRLLELSDEVQALAASVPLVVATSAPADGVTLRIRFSYLQAAVRFTLAVHCLNEAPDAPLQWQVHDWQEGAAHAALLGGGATVAAATALAANRSSQLQEAVGVICEQHRCGFGRLTSICDAVDAMLTAPI
jgi:hypothetical protein